MCGLRRTGGEINLRIEGAATTTFTVCPQPKPTEYASNIIHSQSQNWAVFDRVLSLLQLEPLHQYSRLVINSYKTFRLKSGLRGSHGGHQRPFRINSSRSSLTMRRPPQALTSASADMTQEALYLAVQCGFIFKFAFPEDKNAPT